MTVEAWIERALDRRACHCPQRDVLVTHDKKILDYGTAGHVKVLPT
ncbi:MAG: hypothetical protein ACYCZJ_08840 [Sulfuriferula sp.]